VEWVTVDTLAHCDPLGSAVRNAHDPQTRHRQREMRMKHVRWTDWAAAIALVMALGAFAAAESVDNTDAPVRTQR
jgi:hypothetical protein